MVYMVMLPILHFILVNNERYAYLHTIAAKEEIRHFSFDISLLLVYVQWSILLSYYLATCDLFLLTQKGFQFFLKVLSIKDLKRVLAL